MQEYSIYKDIAARTGGNIYFGVVGPVRTGKSTFIKRFMETLILPAMERDADRIRAQDALPQSAGGRTVMIVEDYDDTRAMMRAMLEMKSLHNSTEISQL